MNDSRRYLVTGGAGFIGSHVVAALLGRGHDVAVIDDLSSGKRDNLEAAQSDAGGSGHLDFIEGSILDDEALARAIGGVDAVLHQAAIPSVPRSFADPAATLRANVEGTTCVLEACRKAGVRRIVMASSSSVYGDTPTLPKEESMPPSPMSPYALSKLTAEQVAEILAGTYGLQIYALRYFNVFGPRQDPTSQYSAAIPKFISAMLAGESPTIYGDGMQSRDFTFIDNGVSANLLAAGIEGAQSGERAAASAPGGGGDEKAAGFCQAINIGAGDRFTVLDLIGALNDILGTGIEPEHTDRRPGDVRHSHASIDKARDLIGYGPLVEFEEGLRHTVNSFRS